MGREMREGREAIEEAKGRKGTGKGERGEERGAKKVVKDLKEDAWSARLTSVSMKGSSSRASKTWPGARSPAISARARVERTAAATRKN